MRKSHLVHRSHSSPFRNDSNDGAFYSSPTSEQVDSSKNRNKRGIIRTVSLHSTTLFVASMTLFFVYSMFSTSRTFHWNEDFPLTTTSTRRDGASYGPRPLLVQVISLELQNHIVTTLALQEQPIPLIENRRNQYWLNHFSEDSDASSDNRRAEFPKENCVALGEWMMRDACNCNTLHEVSMSEFYDRSTDVSLLEYIRDGGFRIAWRTTEYDGTFRVIKTLILEEDQDLDLDNLERHRRDAIAIEQLTASPYVADIYGHCAQSALVDYSDEPSLYHVFDNEDEIPSFDELFQIAYDCVAAVADTHHFNNDGKATLAHMDIKPNQWIFLNDRFQLNDFNLAKFLTWDPEKNQYCGHASGYSSGRWQAPEQYRESAPLSEKADVYSLGNVLYFLLSEGTKPFHYMEGKDAFSYVGNGGKLTITDPKILNSTHSFHVNVRQAMDMCLEHDPDKRPDARHVRDFLGSKLDAYLQEHVKAGDERIL